MFKFSRKLPRILDEYSYTVEYNENRIEIGNRFEAHINVLAQNNDAISLVLVSEMLDNIYRLNCYRSVLDKEIIENIDKTLNILQSSGPENHRQELINNLTYLKTKCGIKGKGYIIK